MPNVLSGLIWVQIVCKDYQQMTLISKEFMTTIKDSESGYTLNLLTISTLIAGSQSTGGQ